MGSSKKHKKNKSERRERYEEYSNAQDPSILQRGLKLILKVGSCSTPEHANSPTLATNAGPPTAAEAMMSLAPGSPSVDEMQLEGAEAPDRHKRSKKKKKKKYREKRHKHHKEKRHRSDRFQGSDSIEPLTQDDYDDDRLSKFHDNVPQNGHMNPAHVMDADSSQDGFSCFGDENSSQPLPEMVSLYSSITTENSPSCQPVSKPIVIHKNEECINTPLQPTQSSPDAANESPSKETIHVQAVSPPTPDTGSYETIGKFGTNLLTSRPSEAPRTPNSLSDSGREPRSCVLKLKQQRTPLNKLLDHLLRSLEKRDPHSFFAWPVTDDIAPGYSSIIDKPMDFSTMRQKIDEHVYTSLAEFTDDFKLICDNAIHYNHVDTVYNKAAKRLWQTGSKMLQAENLLRNLKPLAGFIRELTPKELGFDLRSKEYASFETQDSGDECPAGKIDEVPSAEQEADEKRRLLQQENEPRTRFEPYVDNLTADEILVQSQGAALNAKARLSAQKKSHDMGFLRQNKDGTTTLNIFVGNEIAAPERIINIGDLVGKLSAGSGQLCTVEEKPRNKVRRVRALSYGPFASFAPTFDSRFATLTAEETQLVLNTYGDAASAEYADSLLQFSKDSSYATNLANKLLDIMTNNEHSKCMDQLHNIQLGKYEEQEIGKCFNTINGSSSRNLETREEIEQEFEKYKTTRIDYNRLRTLDELGIDISFLDRLEADSKNFELTRRLHEHLSNNLKLIDKLRSVQNDRLSQPIPGHLAQVTLPSLEETHLAQEVSQHLTDIAKRLPPSAITDPYAIRKALGMTNVGLPPPAQNSQRIIAPEVLHQQTDVPQTFRLNTSELNESCNAASNADCPLPMDMADEFENELREFLDNGSNLHGSSSADESNIVTQFLLN